MVSDYILRRTKEMVLTDMPPKLFRDAELDLSPEQRATYEMAENEGVMHLNEMGDSITIQHKGAGGIKRPSKEIPPAN